MTTAHGFEFAVKVLSAHDKLYQNQSELQTDVVLPLLGETLASTLEALQRREGCVGTANVTGITRQECTSSMPSQKLCLPVLALPALL